MFLMKVPEEGRFSDGRDSSYHSWRGYGYGGGRETILHAQDIFGECGVCHCRPRHQHNCPVEMMGIVGKRMGDGAWFCTYLGRGCHVAGFRKLETMRSHIRPHPHVSRFLGSRRRGGSGCICGLIAVLSTRGFVKQRWDKIHVPRRNTTPSKRASHDTC